MESPPSSRRSAAIERYDVICRPLNNDLQALAKLAAQICGVPMAAISLLTDTEHHHIATYGLDPSVSAVEDSICHPVMDEPALFVPDVSTDPRWSANRFVTGAPAVRLYASAPLIALGGVQVGRLCVFDTRSHRLTSTQLVALDTLASRVMDVLELRARSRQLEDSLSELTAVRDELRRSNEHLTRFAEQISHDLRTPLTSMLANAELLLLESLGDEVTAPIVRRIILSGRRMEGLFDRNLTYARRGGRLQCAEIDLGEVFQRVVADLGPLPTVGGPTISFSGLPRVFADPAMLYLVALNLLTNAVKYARPGVRADILVDAVRRPDAWRVRVRDNGVGLDPAERQRVFGLYERQTSEGDLGAVEGFGIGLASSRRIITAHGGEMGMESVIGPGLLVWFELPVHAPRLDPDPPC